MQNENLVRLSLSRHAITRSPGRLDAALAALLVALVAFLPSVVSAAPRLAVSLLRVDDVLLVPDDVLIAPGATQQLQVMVVYEDGSTEDRTADYTISIDKDDVATIDANGLLRGVAEGDSRIDVLDDSGRRVGDGGDVEVPRMAALTLVPATTLIEEGEVVQLRAFATFENAPWPGIDVTEFVEWTSGKRSVATVGDENGGPHGLVTGLNEGEAKIRAKDAASGTRSSDDEGVVAVVGVGERPTPTPVPSATPAPTPSPFGQPTPTPGSTPDPDPGNGSDLEELIFEPARLDMVLGESVALRVLGEYEDGSVADITHLVTFFSRDTRTATVDANGVVTALRSGQTDIEAEEPESNTSSRNDAEIVIGEMIDITLSPAAPSVEVDEALQLTAYASYDNGRTGVDVTDGVEWSSGKRAIAAVGSVEDGSPGLVTGLDEGVAIISARHRDSGSVSTPEEGTVRVGLGEDPGGPGDPGPGDVLEGELLDMSFEPQALSLLAGETATLRVIGIFEDGSIRDVTDYVELDVRDRSVGDAEQGGVIHGLGEGDTTIRAEEPVSGRRSTVRASLQVAGIVSLSILPLDVAAQTGTTVQLQALATYASGVTGIDVTTLVDWECDDPDVAIIDGDGLLSAIGPGDCKILAVDASTSSKSNRVTAEITGDPVPPPPPEGSGDPEEFVRLRFEPPTVFAIEEGQAQVRAYAVFGDDHEVDVTDQVEFRSRNSRIARVEPGGAILAGGAGTAEVKVIDEAHSFESYFNIVVGEMNEIRIAPAAINLVVGQELEIEARASYDGVAGTENVTSSVGFRSSRDGTAIVEERADGTAWVIAVSDGTAFIQGKHRTEGLKTSPSTGIVTVVSDLQSIKVSPTNRALDPGDRSNYKAKGDFGGGVRVTIEDVTWASLDPTIASVDDQGRVTAHSFGETQIIAVHEETGISSADTSSDTNVAVVGGLVGLQVGTSSSRFPAEPVDLVLAAGETKELKGLALYSGQVEPFNIGSKIDWTSSDPVAVPVDDEGTVSCASIGVSTLSAVDPETGITTTDTLGDATITCAGSVLGIRIDPTSLELDFGLTRQIRAYRQLENGLESDVTRSVSWFTSNDDVATVVETGGEGGKVTGASIGSAVISAFDAEFDVSSDDAGGTNLLVDVVQIPQSLFIESLDGGLVGKVGERIRLRARVTYRGGATEGVNELVEWRSSNSGVVRMGPDAPNFAYLLGVGTVTITATYPGFPEISKALTISVLP